MVSLIREIKAQLRAKAAATEADGERLHVKLSRIEEALYQVRNQSPRDTSNYPIRLNNQLTVLAQTVDMGDGRRRSKPMSSSVSCPRNSTACGSSSTMR